MAKLNRIAFIGNSLPRRCGIATFTNDLEQAIATTSKNVETSIVAMTDSGQKYDYPDRVRFEINDDNLQDYARAAEYLNTSQVDVVSLQHEFGIFGGEAGAYVMELLERLTMPIVTTLHTVLAEPSPIQREVLGQIIDVSSRVVVMAEKGRQLLLDVYQAPVNKIEIIPHGIPDFSFAAPDAAKAALGYSGRPVILTFGLLSPNKGIEFMIDAMPSILQHSPEAVYVVLGATHPKLVRREGEAYRESLIARVQELGIESNVVFLDQFVDKTTLLSFISMCDVYVTPYLNAAQMTSGTLAYSFGLGKAVVSTPYWHARELLAEGRGKLVPFGDAAALSAEIAELLTDDAARDAMRERAYATSRSMTWERTAERYLTVLGDARRAHRLSAVKQRRRWEQPRAQQVHPDMRTMHLMSMCDDTGLLQHAVHSVPDRAHGYCVDDNARALLLACALNAPGEQRMPEVLTSRFAAFVQHAWNPDTRRFRNFMSFDRRWLEPRGSEDSQGRTLWALGECARGDADASRRRWAAALFVEALPSVEQLNSPRAWAFVLLGLDGYCASFPDDAYAARVRRSLADRLLLQLAAAEEKDWAWFESGLSYDNARLPQALLVTGAATGLPNYVAAGQRTLRWLMNLQTTSTGLFRPVGTDGFGDIQMAPKAFDQQPLEAAAAISACFAAYRVDGDVKWVADAQRAFAWFLGANDLSVPLVDVATGACRDGLHVDRANENRGGESVVSYLLGLAEMRLFARTSATQSKLANVRAQPIELRNESRAH